MRAIVIGMGEAGKYIASVLANEKHDVIIIDDDAVNLSRAEEGMDVMALHGHGASLKRLRQAKADTADLVIAVSGSDEINLLAAITAKQLGAKRAIARVDNNEYLEDGRRGYCSDFLGIDLVINTKVLVANEIYKLVKSIGAVAVENFANNRIELLQMEIIDQLKIVEKPLREINLPENSLIAAIMRHEEVIIPNGSDELYQGDEVFVVGTMAAVPRLEEIFGKSGQQSAHKVVIVGGGEVGLAVARLLESEKEISAVLIDSDSQRCNELSASLNRVVIIHGDGTDISLLREEHLESCDVFVAASPDDENNMASSLMAKKLGAKKIVALVNKPDYVQLFEMLGIDAPVSPRLFSAGQILKYARNQEVMSISLLENGKAEILEMVPAPGSAIVDRSLREVNFPRGAVVAAVAGKERVFVPNGQDKINAGDTVVVLTKPEVRAAAERLFRRRLLALG